MNLLRSFRWRILFGTLLWTGGLVPLAHFLFVWTHPRAGARMVVSGVGTAITIASLLMLAGIL
ncbi:MAG TPA: hypothetical protein VKE93_15985, partial [Candidatus Angelobacter sp.]|nr:hypothetical protein [Candidatus Angelobacter sp.]